MKTFWARQKVYNAAHPSGSSAAHWQVPNAHGRCRTYLGSQIVEHLLREGEPRVAAKITVEFAETVDEEGVTHIDYRADVEEA